MGGPIVRTGTTPEYWKNWDNVFGKTAQTGTKKQSAAKKLVAKKAAVTKAKSAKKAKKK